MAIRFEILATSREHAGRLGRVTTPHGSFDTPAFMPVATAAAMKGLTTSQVRATGSQIILNNAFHLMLRPGSERVRDFGGSHSFMGWDGPILTDSGGFQAFSMSGAGEISDHGVRLKSFIDGSEVEVTPEISMKVQNDLGADIIMAFDDCAPAAQPQAPAASPGAPAPAPGTPATLRSTRVRQSADPAARLREAHERTIAWLHRCVAAHRRPESQALFGIVQGGTNLELRRESAAAITAVALPGYAIGGVAVGESPQEIRKVVEFTAPLLPAEKPRYLMGVGYERDIAMAVAAGVDMFDCVLPTRSGRNALVFTRTGPLRLRNARFAGEREPIDPACDCEACALGLSRAYMRHLFMAGEMLGPILASLHNLRHFQRLLLDIRRAIRDDAWSSVSQGWPCLTWGGEPPADLHSLRAEEA